MFVTRHEVSDRVFDAVVAGAGPAGATAACQLVRGGHRVLMVDRLAARVPKIGETLPGAAMRLLRHLDLADRLASGGDGPHWPVGGSLVAWDGLGFRATDALRDPAGRGLRIDRAVFDADLRTAAMAAGVAHRRADVASLVRAGALWTIALDDGAEVAAPWVIDATGRRARIARLLGIVRTRAQPLVALYRTGTPERADSLDRTIIKAGPGGWIYGGRLGSGRWVFGYHTSPREAVRVQAEPDRFSAILAEAPAIRALFGAIMGDPGLMAHDARGGRIDQPAGAGWIACGDAALAFDPIAGQGLFNAVRTGMAAAETVAHALTGTTDTTAYCAELRRVAAHYAARRRDLYQAERRWPDHPFWRSQRGEGAITSPV